MATTTIGSTWTYTNPIPQKGENPMEGVPGADRLEQGNHLGEMMALANKAETSDAGILIKTILRRIGRVFK